MKTILKFRIILLLLVFILGIHSLVSAQTFVAQQGKVHFHSSAPIEDIDAISSEGNCAFNTQTKEVIAKVEITSFLFPNPMMRQHFNESYLESDKFPYTTLQMVITDDINFKKDGVYNVTMKGELEVHGVKRERTINGTLTIKDGQPEKASAEFDVKLADHNIKIPTAVIMKIAEVIKVDVNFVFNKIH